MSQYARRRRADAERSVAAILDADEVTLLRLEGEDPDITDRYRRERPDLPMRAAETGRVEPLRLQLAQLDHLRRHVDVARALDRRDAALGVVRLHTSADSAGWGDCPINV